MSDANDDLPTLELAFPGPEREQGVAAILTGEKTALTGLLQILERTGEALPAPGQRFSVLDSEGQPAALIELTDVSVIPIGSVDDAHVKLEGRRYLDVSEWRAAHEALFASAAVTEFLGEPARLDDEALVVCERFRLISTPDC
jgi:uncharacterized protein YhfF